MEVFGGFDSHLDFIRILKETQKVAREKKTKATFQWRGYSSSVFPNIPEFTIPNLKDRLKMALRGVLNISNQETKVIYIFFFHTFLQYFINFHFYVTLLF